MAQMAQMAHESANRQIGKSASQRISESASQRVSESANQRISESANQRISELAFVLEEVEPPALRGAWCTVPDDHRGQRVNQMLKFELHGQGRWGRIRGVGVSTCQG